MSTLYTPLLARLATIKADVNYSTLCVLLVAALLAAIRGIVSRRKSWIRVGRSPGLFGLNKKAAAQDFRQKGRAMVRAGYTEHKGKNFVIQTAEKEQLVIAPNFLPEIRMLPETKISHSQVLMDYWVGEHIGGDIAMGGQQHIEAVRGPLTRSLKTVVPIMHREYRRTSEALFSQVPKDTKQMNVHQFCYAMVQSLTSTVFIGEELAHGGDWDKIVMEYFPEAWRIRDALKPWPRVLRPLVKPFLVRDNKLEAILTKADRFLEEPIRKRLHPDNQDVDILKFLAEYNESPRKVALQIVGIITGALNTSTYAITQAINDLCAHPEYIADIRAEAVTALASENMQWTLEVSKKLHLLDAFLKESLRMMAPEGLAITRVAKSSFGLSDGTWIPQGTYIAVAGEAMALDPDFYQNPETFDARRFLDIKGLPLSPDREFHGIEPGNGMWGSGRLTCPGRHYASALGKMIVANLLLKYDISLPEGQKELRPGTEMDANLLPDMTQMIVLSELE
ncbi:cytochrome P450 [Truncatella angustata]|uniref:Cytochrome P450 n=1 Tax=Truncatella angustata TaxID=152316 RepID=A0A9P8UFP4_9PEZI|nr:cytochrome P450 [Truncatella angustata]KAH6649112.1 cytochrome P450 [Truncatella angustata]